MKYNVKVPVYDTIQVTVEADNEDEARTLAVNKAVKEHPKVFWLLDEERDMDVSLIY